MNSEYFKAKAAQHGAKVLSMLEAGADSNEVCLWAMIAAVSARRYLSWKRRESRKCQSKRGALRCDLSVYHQGPHACAASGANWNRAGNGSRRARPEPWEPDLRIGVEITTGS